MAECVRVRAAAKVNLHLRVYRRREDGFHGISSLFQAFDLADSLVIRSLKESDTIDIDGVFDCPPASTTIYKAASAYREACGIRTGLSIAVDKRIPAGAGLGGGSSDAAATLRGLEALLGGGLGEEGLAAIGASIGSDVPFFLRSAAALVSGRGEEVLPIEPRTDFRLIVAFPGFPVATGGAYAELDEARPDDSLEPDPSPDALLGAYRNGISSWPFANSFEPVIGSSRPMIPRAKALLLDQGASFAAMSGSGSSVFGVFEGGSRPEEARDRLEAEGYRAYAGTPLARPDGLD